MGNDERTKEERRASWNYALGMSKLSGGEPSPEMLAMVERNINGEMTHDEIFKELHKKYYRPTFRERLIAKIKGKRA